MSDTDPILRAISDGNPSCPDGRALAQLGELIRSHSAPTRAVQLVPRIRHQLSSDAVRIADVAPAVSEREAAAVDDCWEHDLPADAEHVQLRQLIAAVRPPAAIDLTAAVRRRLAEGDQPSEVGQMDTGSRWRLWSAVIAAHVAALLAIALYQSSFHQGSVGDPSGDPTEAGDGSNWVTTNLPRGGSTEASPLPVQLPSQWSDIPSVGGDLFLLRRFPELRDASRRHYGMDASRDVVRQGLNWLQAQVTPEGTLGTLSGNADRDLASQSLAVLALLGEGVDDHHRVQAARSALAWISREAATDHGSVATGIACLALVEGASLLGDAELRHQAERALADLDHGLPPQPGAAGLGGFTLLALETAHQQGLTVPSRLREQAVQVLARSLPQQETDAGRLGLAAFSRLIYGQRDAASTAHQIHLLSSMNPHTAHAGQVDPLGWFFATLAVREAGGAVWTRWSTALQGALIPAFRSAGDDKVRVPGSTVRHADPVTGDVFATSLAILDLQVCYRYLPLTSE